MTTTTAKSMKVAVLGTGSVGQALSQKLVSLGHRVTMGTRDVAAARTRTGKDPFGNGLVGSWLTTEAANGVLLMTFAEAVVDADLVVLATAGGAAQESLALAGAARLKGKVVVDVTNPLDFSRGFPPTLSVCNDTSLGEQLQAAFPDVHIVKTLNTVSNPVMVNPGSVPGAHNLFLSGNDAAAKATVRALLESFGWPSPHVIDLGDITTARGTEMFLPLWVRLFGTLKTPFFNVGIHVQR